ncbi:MAG: tyrosine-type recombinase/integrase [Bacilli bacterium]
MARSEGQVVARGTSVKDGKPIWLVRVFTGRDGSGRKQYLSKTVHGSEREAKKTLREMLQAQDKGALMKESRDTLTDYLAKWLETHKASLRTRTIQSYQELIDRYILPHIGRDRIASLRTVDVQRFYTTLQEQGLGSATIRRVHAILHVALNQAVKWQMIPSNPSDYVDLPKMNTQEMRAFKPDEAKRFLESCVYDRYGTLLLFLLSTGVRPSEAYGLTWEDIDLSAGRATVNRKLTRTTGGGWVFEEPKTRKSRRTIVFPAEAAKALREWKKDQAAEIVASKKYERLNLVFASADGTPIHESNMVRRHFKPTLERGGLPAHFRLYDLRHSYATLSYMAGVPMKVIITNMGHSDEAMFLRVYGHVFDEQKEEAATTYGEFLFGK